jgi:uncharacterized protein (DUF58 family)
MRRREELKHDPLDARQFDLAVKSLANSLSYGMDESIFLGAGIEYLQSRPYQDGDSVKLMDWRVTGRTGKPFVKEYQAPKQVPVYLLLDTSASMCVSSQRLSKYAWAVQLASGLALAAQGRLSPVGVLGCGERDLHVTPTLSRTTVMQWAHHLRYYDFLESTSLGRNARILAPTLRSRCVIIVLSDLHDPDAVPALKLLAQQHECVVLHLRDPAERGIPGSGIYRGREAESGQTLVGHGRTRWISHEETGRAITAAGIGYLLIDTDKPILPKLRGFLKMRHSLLGGGGR